MKKLITLLALIVMTTINAQAPQGFNYQATVRNSTGALILNQSVYFKFNVMLNSQTSVPVFTETHYVPTDDLGQVNLVIGQGTPTTSTFSTINWGTGNYYLGIELNTGSGYVAMGTTQLLSVPYALYALNSGTSKTLGRPTVYITGNITNEQAAAQLTLELGTQTDNVYVVNTTGLTAIDLSAISSLTSLVIKNNENLIDVNLSGLSRTIQVLGISNNPILTTLSFPAYTSGYGEFFIDENATLTSLSFPILKTTANYISFSSNALPSSQINTILNKLLTVTPATGKYINLSGQTPLAPPTGQGIIDKQTLIDALNNVWTDNSVPTLTTTLTLTTRSSVVCGGNITYDGGASVDARGVCWSTSPNPTIALSTITVDGSGTDVFSSFISSLTPATTYYLRAYATNYVGTSYGNEISFTTKLGFEGTYKTIDAAYYRIGVFYFDEASWPAETVIEAVDATTYKVTRYLGVFSNHPDWYFTIVNDVITIPLTYGGSPQLGNGQPFISCASNPTDMSQVNCGSSNVVIRDDVNGKDRLKMSFGYYVPGSGPRTFYQELEKIVN